MKPGAMDSEKAKVEDIKVRLAEGKVGAEMHQFIEWR